MKKDISAAFKRYIVFAENLRDFCERFHRAGAITAFNREADYEDHKYELETYGYTIIPAHDSVTGEIVSYYGKV